MRVADCAPTAGRRERPQTLLTPWPLREAVAPLGITLEEPLLLQIDQRAPVKFRVRYCIGSGCYAFLNIPPVLQAAMEAGSKLTVNVTSYDGEVLPITFSLNGFTATADKLTQGKF